MSKAEFTDHANSADISIFCVGAELVAGFIFLLYVFLNQDYARIIQSRLNNLSTKLIQIYKLFDTPSVNA